MAEWTVEEPRVLTVEEAVRALDVRIVAGRVDVVPTDDEAARVEVSEIDGPPVHVRVVDGTLSIAHDDLHWGGILGWARASIGRRRAVVSVAVPRACDASIGVVSADAVVAGVAGRLTARCVSGEMVVDGVDGDVRIETVSGDVEVRDVSGSISLKTVSGGLTVVDGHSERVDAKTVSGDVALDLQPQAAPTIDIATVSGDLTVRVPGTTGLDVDVSTTSGEVASGFGELDVTSKPGRKRLRGRVGDGAGRLRGRSVSGRVALLSR